MNTADSKDRNMFRTAMAPILPRAGKAWDEGERAAALRFRGMR